MCDSGHPLGEPVDEPPDVRTGPGAHCSPPCSSSSGSRPCSVSAVREVVKRPAALPAGGQAPRSACRGYPPLEAAEAAADRVGVGPGNTAAALVHSGQPRPRRAASWHPACVVVVPPRCLRRPGARRRPERWRPATAGLPGSTSGSPLLRRLRTRRGGSPSDRSAVGRPAACSNAPQPPPPRRTQQQVPASARVTRQAGSSPSSPVLQPVSRSGRGCPLPDVPRRPVSSRTCSARTCSARQGRLRREPASEGGPGPARRTPWSAAGGAVRPSDR